MRRQNPAGDVIMIEVRETGIGISKDGLSKLFQSFSQAETTTANRYGGTGLGLALTRRFCSSMGGAVEVESELGVGSSFKIEVPATPRRPIEPQPMPLAEAEIGRAHVRTPVTNAHLVCRLLLEKKNSKEI